MRQFLKPVTVYYLLNVVLYKMKHTIDTLEKNSTEEKFNKRWYTVSQKKFPPLNSM